MVNTSALAARSCLALPQRPQRIMGQAGDTVEQNADWSGHTLCGIHKTEVPALDQRLAAALEGLLQTGKGR